MKNLDLLRFNYEKHVNNLSNTRASTNKLLKNAHKMKHKGTKLYEEFYRQYSQLSLELANEILSSSFDDLEMYISWLGNNGVSRN